MTPMMYACALIAMVMDRLQKLEDLALVLYNSSRGSAHTVMVRERPLTRNAMFAKVIAS
jgi:hypothetical protein